MSQSILARVPRGFFAAAAVTTVAGPYPLIAQISFARLREGPLVVDAVGKGMAVLAIAYAFTQTACLIVGAPIWITLRLARRESTLAYGGLGFLIGLGWSVAVFGERLTIQPLIWPIIGWVGLVSCAAATAFWWVVREPIATVANKSRSGADQ